MLKYTVFQIYLFQVCSGMIVVVKTGLYSVECKRYDVR